VFSAQIFQENTFLETKPNFPLTEKCFSLTNFSNGKQTQENLEPETTFQEINMALICLYCANVFAGGGINRFKQHLAGAKGEVEQCRKCPPDVQHQMLLNLKGNAGKKKELEKCKQISIHLMHNKGSIKR
jgi:hypothetical protein